MAFNHYAKIKRILAEERTPWLVKRIDKPTQAKNFKGVVISYPHYYRVIREDGSHIPFCKFQKIDLFAKTMNIPVELLPIIE